MKGWLIYDEIGAARNAWFIDRLQREAEEVGLELRLQIYDGRRLPQGELPSFAIVRCISPALNARLQSLGVRVFNNAETARVANDKWETYRFCTAHAIPVLPTWRWTEYEGEYPCVVKARDGHGGSEVFWANTPTLALPREREAYIAQRPNEILGVDTRVYALGGKVVAAVRRTSKKDFKSNFSLGGEAELVEPTEEQRRLVERLHGLLGYDFVGIDFLPTKTGFVLNEIEDAAGTRMLYRCSEIDMARTFIRYVKDCL